MKSHIISHLILILFAILVVTFCSDTSPLYHFSSSPDPSIFFMCGRLIGTSLVPYVDFADTKGILLWFIYFVATYIDETSFMGVYIIQCVSLYITFCFLKKTARLYLSEKNSYVAIILVCFFLFDSFHYQRGGGVEELYWPFMSALAFCLARHFLCYTAGNRISLFICMGICIGSAFMIKYSIALPIAALCIMLMFYEWWLRDGRVAFISACWALLGFNVIVLPCVAYLYFVGGLNGFVNEYLQCSFRYGVSDSSFSYMNFLRPLPFRCKADILMWVAVIWAVKSEGLRALYNNKGIVCAASVYLLFKLEMITIYNYYYNSVLSPLMIVCCIFVVSKVMASRKCVQKYVSVGMVVLLLVGALNNQYGSTKKRAFIWEKNIPNCLFSGEVDLVANKKILYLGWLDQGFGVPYNWTPCGRYWFLQNNPSRHMVEEQFEYVKQKKPDIIHSRSIEYHNFLCKCGYKLFHEGKCGHFYTK